jgi:hypothetical protein
MTSDMVVHKDERGIELRRSAFIGNDLDAERAIPVLVFINDRLFGARRGDCSKHLPNGHGLEPARAFPDGWAANTVITVPATHDRSTLDFRRRGGYVAALGQPGPDESEPRRRRYVRKAGQVGRSIWDVILRVTDELGSLRQIRSLRRISEGSTERGELQG